MNEIDYRRDEAVAYAHRWAFGRNPQFGNFDAMGGDCTNFISQCLLAGGAVMNVHNPMGWYYKNLNDRAPAWTGVPYLYNFLIKNEGVGPYAREVPIEAAMPGDIVQLSFDGVRFSHTLLIVRVESPSREGILIATHTLDSDNRAVASYTFQAVRYLHVEGVRG